ncbi:cupin domain-containing protein [Enterovibrio norvegicus]|uniref:Cupin n=1 Tax=Enterovibrio norvegicus TaxID=188144 RepID=A0A2N7LH11_9GAMM|nr:cupin domain-containing protein [Enterovibrio norvegicus]PMN94834.1 cupin [Enterovibrio norvegicus]
MFKQNNLLENLPNARNAEVFDEIIKHPFVRIERIVSRGQTTPETDWYDQDEHEWVMVLEGNAELLFEDGRRLEMRKGDQVTLPAHTKHRVSWTDPDQETVWLAVFYRDKE